MKPDTQKQAWTDLQDKLSQKQISVLYAIKALGGKASLWQITNLLKWPINNISGRVTELKREKMIIDSGERSVNPKTMKKAIIWKVNK